MADYTSDFDTLASQFSAMGIPTDRPGFYDSPAFVEAERREPTFIEKYAAFVKIRSYDAAYLARAEQIIRRTARILNQELVADSRLGACIDLSMVLSRILELEGVWNYMVKGALTITFPARTGIPSAHFYAADVNDSRAGHVWADAPPFEVVDLTLRQQPHGKAVAALLPETILEETGSPATASYQDVFSPAYQALAARAGYRANHLFSSGRTPRFKDFTSAFPPCLVVRDGVSLKYVPCAIGAPDNPLEGIKTMSFSGRSGAEVYSNLVQPALDDLRG